MNEVFPHGNSYVVLVIFHVDPARAEEFSEAMLDTVASTRAAAGNQRYDFSRDPSNPGRFMFYEIFDDEAAWETHHARPQIQSLLQLIKPMLLSKPDRSVWARVGTD
jgi:quinol monooxygenase YgiN